MAGTGDKLLTAAEIKEVTDTKVDKDFSALTALPNGLSDTDLINVRRSGTNYKLSGSDLAPTPLVVSITTGQWSGSGSDYYITVTASNVTENSILVPTYDHTSDSRLNGPVWCVPAAGSFTIHTSAIPTGTVTIMVQFVGTLGEAQYQVLADVYSKSQTDAIVAQSTACKYLNDVSKSVIQLLDGDYGNLTDGEFKEYRIRASDYTVLGFIVRHTPSYAAGILCTLDPGVILHAVKKSAAGSFELVQI